MFAKVPILGFLALKGLNSVTASIWVYRGNVLAESIWSLFKVVMMTKYKANLHPNCLFLYFLNFID